jgi:hypothetical protein
MKMLMALGGLMLMAMAFAANTYEPAAYNPFTGKLDYVTTGFENLTINGTLTVVGNVTASWFKGMFNWTEDSPYLSFTGALLSFNETKLNSTITSLNIDTIWNITGSPYLYNNSGNLDFNETKVNATIDAREVDTRWDISTSNYLINNSNILDVNETKMNTTISGSATFVKKAGDTMSGDLNMGSKNVTSVDCIVFASGGQICDAP